MKPDWLEGWIINLGTAKLQIYFLNDHHKHANKKPYGWFFIMIIWPS